jgi:two-component system, OmpR family, response regulator
MKILLIDDNKEITDAICLYLESEEASCTVTNSGREGLEMIKSRNDFNLILLDIAIPDFSGYDILDQLRKDDLISTRNIILFTASVLDEKRIFSYGVKGIIKKPLSIDDLQATIDRFKD